MSARHSIEDPDEILFWTVMRSFEALALRLYRTHAPTLAGPAKSEFTGRLMALFPTDSALDGSDLAAPARALLEAAESKDALSVLFVQGLLLETLAQALYSSLTARAAASAESSALAEAGRIASLESAAPVPALIKGRVSSGPDALAAFTSATREVLTRLDTLGEAIDARLGERFDLRFSEVIGDLTADLVPVCVRELGMDRRRLICHVTGSLMGVG